MKDSGKRSKNIIQKKKSLSGPLVDTWTKAKIEETKKDLIKRGEKEPYNKYTSGMKKAYIEGKYRDNVAETTANQDIRAARKDIFARKSSAPADQKTSRLGPTTKRDKPTKQDAARAKLDKKQRYTK